MIDDKSTLDKVVAAIESAAWIVPELLAYAPFDLFTAPIRDRVLPYSWKAKYPVIACRGFRKEEPNKRPKCKPGEKYEHKTIMKCICWNYNRETGECMKKKK